MAARLVSLAVLVCDCSALLLGASTPRHSMAQDTVARRSATVQMDLSSLVCDNPLGRYCTWKAFKSGDTWKNTFGEVGATRYDTYLSTYRSSIYLYRSSRLRSTRSSRSSQQIETPAQKYGFFFFLVPGQVSKDSLSGMQRATLRKNGSGDAWQVFKSGDTWRNTFGEVGATRYDTYLSTYRSSMDVYRTRRLPPRSMPKPSVDELLVRSRSRRVGLVFGLFSESEEAEARIWWLSFIAGAIITLPFCSDF